MSRALCLTQRSQALILPTIGRGLPQNVRTVITLNGPLGHIWNIPFFYIDEVFWDEISTLELHISVLRAGLFPVLAFRKTVWAVLSHTCFVIAVSRVKNSELSEIKPKTSFTHFLPHLLNDFISTRLLVTQNPNALTLQ